MSKYRTDTNINNYLCRQQFDQCKITIFMSDDKIASVDGCGGDWCCVCVLCVSQRAEIGLTMQRYDTNTPKKVR